MANNASAKKRIRKSLKANLRNRKRREKLRKSIKEYKTAIATADTAGKAEALKKVSKAVDQAGNKGILHRNNVNRKKSRLAKAANRAAAAAKTA